MKYNTRRLKKIQDLPLKVLLGPYPNRAYAKLVAEDPVTGKQHYIKWLNAHDAEELINELEV